MPPTSKVRDIDALAGVLAGSRSGKTVVHCHGVFDLMHIGHIRHFQEARKLGDILVVTVTPDRFVNKGPHRPVFTESLRAEAIASLGCVDYVAVNKWPTAVEALSLLKPDIYAKGSDYRDAASDHTGGITRERQAVELAVGREADELDHVGERVRLYEVEDPVRAGLAELPRRIERRRDEEHREDHEVHRTGEVLELADVHRQQQAERAEHQAADVE